MALLAEKMLNKQYKDAFSIEQLLHSNNILCAYSMGGNIKPFSINLR